ncbi:hypothetical protein [Chryseobacterium sp.]|uniref:hypothetical protein n=1 Tax=Chryseobacterium sp. TaxID=1871047 RepID=UPI00388FE936
MKKNLLTISFLSISLFYNAQVGVNTESPNATLDVKEKRAGTTSDAIASDGILIPKLTKLELAAKAVSAYTAAQNGAIIFVTDISGTPTGASIVKVANIDSSGFYYYDATVSLWKKMDTNTNTNLYNTDGNLTNPRVVTQGTNTLAFTGTATNAFSVDGTTLSVDAANNRVGIGTATPSQPLDVNANSNPLQITNLAFLPSNTTSNSIVIDSSGKVYKNTTQNVEGQIMRYPLTGGAVLNNVESPIRLTATQSLAPNNAENLINTIIGGSITSNVSAPSGGTGSGTTARTTEQITLPAGIYKIEVRLIGFFATANSLNHMWVKAIVNNKEYSIQPFSSNTSGNQYLGTGFVFSDYINLPSQSTLDFTILVDRNDFTIVSSQSPGSGTSYRSLVLVQRLK